MVLVSFGTESWMDTVIFLTTPVQKKVTRARAGMVMLIDGVPGVVIAPYGRAQALLQIGVGNHQRVHTVDITGDAGRLRRAVLALPGGSNCPAPPGAAGRPALSPGGPSQQHHRPVWYQGRRRQPGGIPATGKEEHGAR
jgi:hypothetical protein